MITFNCLCDDFSIAKARGTSMGIELFQWVLQAGEKLMVNFVLMSDLAVVLTR